MAKSNQTDRKLALRRVLVVEDDAILALNLEEELREAGVSEVLTCASIAEAMEEIERASTDALVLDVHLADRDDGWKLAELVTVLGPRPPKIVFATGSPESIPADIAAMGAVLEKPYSGDDLIAALGQSGRTSLFTRLRRG